MKQNLFSFSLSFWVHITFHYVGSVEGKQIKLYLSLMGFNVQIFFSLFTGEGQPGVAGVSVFLGWPLSKNRRFFSKFLKRKNGILALRVYGPIIWLFPFPTIPSGHDTRVTWIPFFVQQNAGHRVRGADPHSYIILTVSLSARWFKHRGVEELTPLFPLSVAYHVT